MDLPGCTPMNILSGNPEPKPPSQFGNPVWGSDQDTYMPTVQDEWRGRRDGLREALRLITGPAIMTNNREFQTGLDAAIDLLTRRLAEL